MTDRPIIFSAPMVRALLDGRKTQTRRLAWRLTTHAGRFCDEPTAWRRVKPGDQLWVRETFQNYFKPTPTSPGCIYRADCHEFTGNRLIHQIGAGEIKWRSAIHMPRWASRLTLTVTAARVERLNDISLEDAEAEGWPKATQETPLRDAYPVAWFANLWNDLHGANAYGTDPEVVALTFTVAKRNIDAKAAA